MNPEIPSNTKSPTASKKTDFEDVRRSQKAMRAALRGEVPEKEATPALTRSPTKRAVQALNETGRETALFRAASLLSTMTQYYGITVGELEDEKIRMAKMSDEKLLGVTSAFEYASRHVTVMLSDDKAREAAIAKDPKTSEFYKENGVTEDDWNDADRKSKAPGRRMQNH